ncbi:NAD(P)-dependent dehydrogenase, short-chain alcohol dehydrogenase family [Kosakonia arachidis]|uniref:NAD(P)-dependent dehydrogenase, short-chain alcohol dehydrogenase family n=1 Tax=Kosakonia arachidis TaxID=551989 RepID=A0A1I7B103_9ENTR|nr:SDR family oxidoreductase [Kosakonia arachidis]SFT80886.1 NAD(P)-dependent dehydrogenase, short-chain alcohol dehydrogenase family [Kosakonia arachidis]
MNEQRIALVTGANKGIGFEIARQLAQAGVIVIMGARDFGRGNAAADALKTQGLSVRHCELDITRHDSIAAAASSIKAEFGKLDILVNNAGVFDHADGPPSKAAIDAVRHVMETNFIGTLAVTQAMLPLLQAVPAARIVNVSSSLGSLTLNGDPTSTYYAAQFIGYNASKTALNMLTVQLSEELKGTGITVNSVSPGFVKTDLTGYGTMTPAEGAKLPVKFALEGNESGEFMGPDGRTPW